MRLGGCRRVNYAKKYNFKSLIKSSDRSHPIYLITGRMTLADGGRLDCGHCVAAFVVAARLLVKAESKCDDGDDVSGGGEGRSEDLAALESGEPICKQASHNCK